MVSITANNGTSRARHASRLTAHPSVVNIKLCPF
jgi:hypothetical protein